MTRLDTLIEAYLAGSSTADEVRELETLLATPEARRMLVEHSMLEGQLQEAFKRRVGRVRPARWPWAVAAAAVVLVALFVRHVMNLPPDPEPVVKREPPPRVRVAEEHLQSIQRQEEEAVRERTQAETEKEEGRQEEWAAQLRRLQEERVKAERELAEARRPEPTPEPPPVIPPKTEAAVAKVNGRDLLAGAAVESAGVVEFPNGARVTLSRKTAIQVGEGSITLDRGRVDIAGGLAVTTPHGAASMVGAAMRVIVTPDSSVFELTKGTAKVKDVTLKAGMFITATAKSTSAAQPLPKDEVLFALKIEEGKKADLVDTGSVERGPGNRTCLAGAAQASGICRMMIGDGRDGLFTMRGDEVLTFDYWVDSKANKVNLNVLNRTQGRTHEMIVPKLVTGKWTRATLKLSDFAGSPKAGDWIINVYLQGVGDGERRFYIDNLQFTRPRLEK